MKIGNVRLITIASLCFVLTSSAFSFGKPEHSSVDFSQTKQADGSISLSFKVIPHADMAITHEAPWSLSFEPSEALTFLKADDATKNLYKNTSYRQDLPGFIVAISPKPGKKTGELTYKLKAFVCTKDKKRCFPETHQGKIKWQN